MLTVLKFSSLPSHRIAVEYVTDLNPTITEGNFTVMDIRGLNEKEIKLGMAFKQLAYDVVAFKTFATANNLQLSRIDTNGTTVLVAGGYSDASDSITDETNNP